MTRIFRGKITNYGIFIKIFRIFGVILPRKIRVMTQIETPLSSKREEGSFLEGTKETCRVRIPSRIRERSRFPIRCPLMTSYDPDPLLLHLQGHGDLRDLEAGGHPGTGSPRSRSTIAGEERERKSISYER